MKSRSAFGSSGASGGVVHWNILGMALSTRTRLPGFSSRVLKFPSGRSVRSDLRLFCCSYVWNENARHTATTSQMVFFLEHCSLVSPDNRAFSKGGIWWIGAAWPDKKARKQWPAFTLSSCCVKSFTRLASFSWLKSVTSSQDGCRATKAN